MTVDEIKYVKKFPPCDIYDVGRIEHWLTDMAAEGYRFNRYSFMLGFFEFAVTAPARRKYRMVAGRKVMWRGPVFNEPDNDESHMYRHYGWNYISTVGGFYVFENDGAKAGELDTEPETMAGALKSLYHYMIYQVCFLTLMVVVLGVQILPVLMEVAVLALAAMGIFYGWFIYVAVSRMLAVMRLRNRLLRGIPVDHEAEWRDGARLGGYRNLILAVVTVVLLVIMFILTCF